MINLVIPEGVTSIGNYVFSGWSALLSVTFPSSLKKIGSSAFNGCSGLTSIEIPNSVTNVGGSAFSGCSGLTSIDIPTSWVTIIDGLFSRCIGLQSVNIPNNVKAINQNVFAYCSGLQSVVIGYGVTKMGGWVFRSCDALTNIYCYASVVPSESSLTFSNYPISSATLHVPEELLSDYQATSPWNGFGSIVPLTVNDPQPTAIVNVNRETTGDNRYYTLDGREVQHPTKGVYIHNGRMVLIK